MHFFLLYKFSFFFGLLIMFNVRVWGCGFSERCETWVRESENTEESQDIRDSLLWWDGAKHPASSSLRPLQLAHLIRRNLQTEGEHKYHHTHDCFYIHAEDVSVQSQLPYTRDTLGKYYSWVSFTKTCFLALFNQKSKCWWCMFSWTCYFSLGSLFNLMSQQGTKMDYSGT